MTADSSFSSKELPINQIICGDCVSVMKAFPDESIDFVVTSPPYKDEEVNGDYYLFLEKLLKEFDRIVKYYSFIFLSSIRIKEVCRRFDPERILIWYKPRSQYTYRYEPIFVFKHNSDLKINKRIWSDTFKFLPVWDTKIPYANPLKLYIALIKMVTLEGDVVLDPFLGSGTTALACEKLNRKWIGIDLNPTYVEMARKRLASVPEKLEKFLSNPLE